MAAVTLLWVSATALYPHPVMAFTVDPLSPCHHVPVVPANAPALIVDEPGPPARHMIIREFVFVVENEDEVINPSAPAAPVPFADASTVIDEPEKYKTTMLL